MCATRIWNEQPANYLRFWLRLPKVYGSAGVNEYGELGTIRSLWAGGGSFAI